MFCLRLIVPVFILALLTAAPLAAQQPAGSTPRIEVGIDGAIAGPDGGTDQARVVVAPRLTVNVSPRTALILSGDAFTTKQTFGFDASWEDSHLLTVEMRRALIQTGRFAMSGLAGAGVGYRRMFQDEFTIPGRDGPVVQPSRLYTNTGPEFTLGLGLEQRVATRLALRQEVRVILGETSEFRAQAGVSVPLGRYPVQFDPPLTRSGQRPDSLRNGTGIGALVGAAVMTGFVGFLAHSLCEGDCENLGAALAVGAGYGAGAGSLTGAMIDSFIE